MLSKCASILRFTDAVWAADPTMVTGQRIIANGPASAVQPKAFPTYSLFAPDWLLFPPRAKAKIRCPSKLLSCVPESDRFSFHYFLLSREGPISHRGQCRHRRPAETYFWKQTPQ